jgi:anaerobic selenocysteine-containing dehydrogenase
MGMSTLSAIQSLWALTGNVDVPGGNIINRPDIDYVVPPLGWGSEDVAPEVRAKTIGPKEYPFCRYAHPDMMLETMLTDDPYPFKMAWLQATNPLACMGSDPKKILKAMRRLDFVVVADLFMTPSAMALADLVLPVASALERNSIRSEFIGGWWGPVRALNKVIQVGECKSDEEILLDVGRRLNPKSFPWENVEKMFDWLLRDTGVTFKELREGTKKPLYAPFHYRKHEKGKLRDDGKPGFNTPNGKFNLYNPVFKKIGLEPFPYYEEPPESPVSTPDLAKEYPLVLTTGARSWSYFHSEHRQIPMLREIAPDPEVEINTDTAAKLNIVTGDWVWIENSMGKCKQKAKVVATIDPRVVSAKHAWWFPEKKGPEPSLFGLWESNINQLMPAGQNGPSGLCAPYKSLMCKIYKV